MNTHIKAMSATGALLGALASASAMAIPTDVQLNWDGVAGFDTTAINEFDWQSSGDMVVVDAMPVASTYMTAGGAVSTTSFSAWAAGVNANPLLNMGSTVSFNINAQARLNDLLNIGGGSVAPSALDTNGSALGDAGFEITGVLSATETAVFLGFGVMSFTSITGSYNWYLDQTPDSDVALGTGFTDGIKFLTGATVGSSGAFTFGSGGSVLVTNSVTSYDGSIIETDPLTNSPLIGTTFDTLISLVSLQANATDNGHEASASDAGDLIGNAPGYTVLAIDQGFKADANSEFQGTVPEPATLALLGAGLMGLAGLGRGKRKS